MTAAAQKPPERDCYDDRLPGEPHFILLARDPLAHFLVSIWSAVRMNDWEKANVVFEAMIERAGWAYSVAPDTASGGDAIGIALAMFKWREAHDGSWRWIDWNGGKRPVPACSKVEVRIRDGRRHDGPARSFRWQQGPDWNPSCDIVAYRPLAEKTGAPAAADAPILHSEAPVPAGVSEPAARSEIARGTNPTGTGD